MRSYVQACGAACNQGVAINDVHRCKVGQTRGFAPLDEGIDCEANLGVEMSVERR